MSDSALAQAEAIIRRLNADVRYQFCIEHENDENVFLASLCRAYLMVTRGW